VRVASLTVAGFVMTWSLRPAPVLAHTRPVRRTWSAAFPDVRVLDVTGPLEVFSIANRLGGARTPGDAVSVVAGSRHFKAS
jgi:hypothetical protein